MNRNEKRLLRVFILLCAGIPCVLSMISGMERYRSAKDSEQRYLTALERMEDLPEREEPLEARLRVLKEEEMHKPPYSGIRSVADMMARIRNALEQEGIRPSRYQISGKAPDETVEFVLRAPATAFLRFLKSEMVVQESADFSYLAIKSSDEGSFVDVIFRVRYGK